MKTFQIQLHGEDLYIKSNADSVDIQNAIDFTPIGEKFVERLLQAIRIKGFKATEIKLDPVDIFEVE